MHVGRYRPGVPASGTRDRRLRGYLVSFARCLRVETDLAAAVLLPVLNLDHSIFDRVRRHLPRPRACLDSCGRSSPRLPHDFSPRLFRTTYAAGCVLPQAADSRRQ